MADGNNNSPSGNAPDSGEGPGIRLDVLTKALELAFRPIVNGLEEVHNGQLLLYEELSQVKEQLREQAVNLDYLERRLAAAGVK
jgi:hypothetical protein